MLLPHVNNCAHSLVLLVLCAVLCDIHNAFCTFQTFFFTILTVLVVWQTILGLCQRARMLRARQLQLRSCHIQGDCFDHASFTANIVFRDHVDGVGAIISG